MRPLLLAIWISLTFLSCQKQNLPPNANLKVFPTIGDTSILFQFNAGSSEDDRDYPISLMFRWDINGDGDWDSNYSHFNTIGHRFVMPGSYQVSVEVMDLDGNTSTATGTVEVFGENPDTSSLCDPRDGKQYRIVRISDRWWMSENLRYGVVIPSSEMQTDNQIVEMYQNLDPHSSDSIGGVYYWFEAMNYSPKDQKGICPDDWHIPTNKEWAMLIANLPTDYALQYYGNRGLSNLNLDKNTGGIRMKDGSFIWGEAMTYSAGFWSSSYLTEDFQYQIFSVYFQSRFRTLNYGFLADNQINGSNFVKHLSVRCIKDF
jgi:uncharacterized protein (TIGR02145 family)